MNTGKHLLSSLLLGTFLSAAAHAQTPPPAAPAPASEFFGGSAGLNEITLSGSGFSTKEIDSSSGGLTLSLGRYLSDNWLLSLRQSATYVNPDNAGSSWAGSTRAAFDFHFPTENRLRPFIGTHLGGIYGRGVNDTFTAGLEAGLKYYVLPRTFLYLMADYSWAFDDSDDIDDAFSDGGYQWNVGIGYNF